MNRWGLIRTPMRLVPHLACGSLAAVLLAGLAACPASNSGQNKPAPAAAPSAPVAGENIFSTFFNRLFPAKTPDDSLHFATVPARASQMVLDGIPKKEISPGVEIPLVDVSPPLAGYEVDDVVSLLASGNLSAEAKLTSYGHF